MYNFDLSSGYHYINIFEPHQTSFGIGCGEEFFYAFLVLPFSLSTAGHVFTKALEK